MGNLKNRVLVCICGHGGPNYEHKQELCLSNLNLIKSTCPVELRDNIDIEIYCYDRTVDTSEYIDRFNAKIITEPGIIGEFIYKYIKPDRVKKYSRVILLLDDIKLDQNFNLHNIITIQDENNFDIISPCLSPESKYSHAFMLRDDAYKTTVRNVNFLEFFMYIFNPKNDAYCKWYNILNKHVKWLWGIDYILNNLIGLKLGILNTMSMTHFYIKTCCDILYAEKEMLRLCRKYNINLTMLPKLNLNLINV